MRPVHRADDYGMNSWKVFGSAAAVSALCASAILWAFPADVDPSDLAAAPDSKTAAIGAAPQAVSAAAALSRAFPGGGTPDLAVKGWPFPCKTSHAPLASASRTRQAGSGGLLAAARLYTAGYGAVALQDLQDAATACGAAVSTVSVGDNGFIAYDQGYSKTGAAAGQTVAFRVGDAVGFVVVRGAAAPNPLTLAQQWAPRWPDILQASGCASVTSSTQAHLRNPLDPSYEGKLRSRIVALNATALRDIERDVTPQPERLWTEPRPDRATTPLPDYPDSLAVSLPAAPANVAAPAWPNTPETTTSVNESVRDATGPGCGWSFTGLTEPDFDAEKAQRSSDARAERATDTLTQQWTEYTAQRVAYQQEYRDYRTAVAARNDWAREATQRIAVAWWNEYDTQVQQYRDEVTAWEKARKQWEQRAAACDAENSDAESDSSRGDAAEVTPTPTTTPGDGADITPTPCDPGDEPTPPGDAPTEPTVPRPSDVVN